MRIALLLAVSGTFVLLRARADATRATAFLGVGWALGWLLIARAAAWVAPVYSGIDLAGALSREQAPASAPIYSVATYDQSLTFYLRRPVTLVEYRGELDYGLNKMPGTELSRSEFLRRWSAPSAAYAVMEKAMFEDLEGRGVPMRLITQNGRRVLVSRQ